MDKKLKLKIKALDNYFCFKYNITVKQLKSKSHNPDQALARFLCWYYLTKHTRFSLTKIGSLYNRSHSTVHFGLKRLDNFLATEKDLMHNIDKFNLDVKNIFNSSPTVVNSAKHLIVLDNRSLFYISNLNR